MLPALRVWLVVRLAGGYSDEQWKMIVKQFRDEPLPLDVLVLDSDSEQRWSGPATTGTSSRCPTRRASSTG